jgi:hypothetical protein
MSREVAPGEALRRPFVTKSTVLMTAAFSQAIATTPGRAQKAIYNPGYCAQLYPDAN